MSKRTRLQWVTRERDALQDHVLAAAARLGAQLLGETWDDEPVELPSWQEATLRALQARICRRDRDDLPTPDKTDAWTAMLRTFATLPEEQRTRLSALLVLIEVAPWVIGPQRTFFSRMNGWAQDTFLTHLQTSSLPPLRAIFFALKSLCSLHYWSQPATWDAIGYSLRANPGMPQDRV